MIYTILHIWVTLLFVAALFLVAGAFRELARKSLGPKPHDPVTRSEFARMTGGITPYARFLLQAAVVLLVIDLICSQFISK